ncbi:programmed cell death protein 2 [Schizophyllum amplum]|uniref:Programmed cell death protein 2 n=1 Tax=Schizophyllum amplum TaxID=97359 RepID=A0A550CK59_9AGAR|nr:programmed cell death protein 2 [Auriculariopsis ampla]
MPARTEDDWSDSDDELAPSEETSVLLGAFLPSADPPLAGSACKICKRPTELIVQLWCPLEDSPMDRALYVWACARAGCQAQEGSVRAYRGLRYNEAYAEKLAQKAEKKKAKAAAKPPQHQQRTRSLTTNDSTENDAASATDLDTDADASDAESDTSDTSTSSLVVALASTTLADSPWRDAPAYPPLYLSTAAEYVPPEPKEKKQQIPTADDLADFKDLGEFKGLEKYENSLDVDAVFERFVRRVGFEGEQCIRCLELGGTPLPFATDAVYDKLFPLPREPLIQVTGAAFKVTPPVRRTYEPASVPACPRCGGPRVFECQLMPNLINVLRAEDEKKEGQGADKGDKNDKDASKNNQDNKTTDAEARRKELERALKGGKDADARGLDWGTCMVFSCAGDCCLGEDGAEAKECWREELVMIQADV